jgi:hypothetical protein
MLHALTEPKEFEMQKCKMIARATLAAALLGLGVAAQAQITVRIAPPQPQYEVVPSARPGQVWITGHYDWRNGQYVWVPGRFERDRTGYEFREHRWVQRGNGEWYLVGGNWERRGPGGDRDGDGVANRHDPDNRRFGPYGDLDRDGVRNRDDRDRDGDGIRNGRDRFPDDRRRS